VIDKGVNLFKDISNVDMGAQGKYYSKISTNKNMNSKVSAMALAIGLNIICINSAKAGCYPSTAADSVDNFVAAGMSFDAAIEAVKRKGYIDSNDCIIEVRGIILKYGDMHPNARKALQR
jgi:hypothetical protein